jgi:hypothetical protein
MNTNLQLGPPSQTFLSPLLELRDYYARLVEEYESLHTQARSQLNHVEALLSNWSSRPNSEVAHKVPLLSLPDNISRSDIELVESNQAEEFPALKKLEVKSYGSKIQNSNDFPAIEISLDQTEDLIKGVDIPMLPQYQHLTRMEAIKKLLQDNLGIVCHIDFVVRTLYGELQPQVFRVVKGRVQSSLTQGKERSIWSAIPDEPGCYTLDLGLVTSNHTNGYSQSAKKKKKPFILPKTKIVPMLSAFEGQFLIDAISSLLRQNPGKIFTVAEVITGLYGEIDSQEVREIKSKVLNELSRGYRTGRFSRIPEKVGLYTWDVKLTETRV